ncbi:bifunctional protein-serine/threonine kinase/phosphatase [Maricurvus nonylphenolicus]|uniref:protein kinase domain-containing protein n=1 Tax=Maricurvus nonylphenolicus TaxID=1008307 RepID=UPI0036F2AAF2
MTAKEDLTTDNREFEDIMPLLPFGDDQPQLDVEFGGHSIAGRKEKNEDAFAARQPDGGERYYKGVVACVADGVSCSENAQQASQTSVMDFIENYYSTPDTWGVKQAAAKVLSSLNSWLFHHGQQGNLRHNGLVTTFSGAILKSTTAHIFHAGDSRIYRLRQGNLEQVTRDHTHKQIGTKAFLTRALGMDSRLDVDYQQKSLKVGDVLMLTTDGVHDTLKDHDLLAMLQAHLAETPEAPTLEQTARRIVDDAYEAGSEDNISCLLVKIKELPIEDINEVHRKLTKLTIPPVMEPGHKIDGYEIQKIVHSGTRSHLYLVKQMETGKKYVLKAPSENFAEDAQYLEGFIREQWVGRRINHPNVMKIYPRPAESPFMYHLCEYIEGTSLRQWMIDNPQPSLAKVRELAKGMVAAVRVFQRQGMVHRDIKPENILLDEHERVRLIDFGTVQVDGLDEIATPLGEEVPVGSVNYIAPEYLRGEKGQHYSDIFSLGVILYEMCTGTLPFKQTAAQQQQPQHYQEWNYIPARRARPELPLWLDLTLEKASDPNPAKRYHVMSELLHDLSSPNAELVAVHKSAPLLKRNPTLFWQGISALLAVGLVAQWVYMSQFM